MFPRFFEIQKTDLHQIYTKLTESPGSGAKKRAAAPIPLLPYFQLAAHRSAFPKGWSERNRTCFPLTSRKPASRSFFQFPHHGAAVHAQILCQALRVKGREKDRLFSSPARMRK